MAEILSVYLQREASNQFQYGFFDCATFVCGWFDILTGKDHAKCWREKYQNENDCGDFIANNGGFVAIADRFLQDNYSAKPTSISTIGNAVFVSVKNIEAMGLMCSDNSVALRTLHGIHITSKFNIISQWGLQCQQSSHF